MDKRNTNEKERFMIQPFLKPKLSSNSTNTNVKKDLNVVLNEEVISNDNTAIEYELNIVI